MLADLADDGDQLLDVGRGQAGGGLVEQQQLRVERERARDLEQRAACRRAGCAPPRGAGRPRPTNSSRPSARACAAARSRAVARRVQGDVDQVAAEGVVQADHHVLQRRHLAEQLHVLERARDARQRDVDDVRPTTDWPANASLPGGRHVDAGQHVHHRALARAVRPDQAVDRAAPDDQVDVVERLQAAELHQHLARLQHLAVGAAARGRRRRRRPARRRAVDSAASVDRPLQVERVADEADDAVLQVVDDEQRDQAEDREPPVGHRLQHERERRERDAADDRDRHLLRRAACRAAPRRPRPSRR